jgi:hypothetical protein
MTSLLRTAHGAVLCGALLASAGCQQKAPAFGTIASPPQQVAAGSRFDFRVPLSFPPKSGEIFFQNEKIAEGVGLASNMPYCRLRPIGQQGPSMASGTYTVGAVTYDERESWSGGALRNVTRITLGAEGKPPAYALSCGWPEGAPAQGFLTAQQIYSAIGGQLSMDIPR